MEEIKKQIKARYAEFGTAEFNAMTIMNAYIFDNPKNTHYRVEAIQAVYAGLKSEKQEIISDIEIRLRGKYVIIASSFDEDTQEATPAVYYKVSTMADLITELGPNGDWDKEAVFNELKGDMTWAEMQANYN